MMEKRHFLKLKWGLLLILVALGCLYFTAIPSALSKLQDDAVVDDDDDRRENAAVATTSRGRDRRSESSSSPPDRVAGDAVSATVGGEGSSVGDGGPRRIDRGRTRSNANNRTATLPRSPPENDQHDQRSRSTDVDLVSLTIRDDFFVLFNNSALTSWLRHIRNVRSVTFVGPPGDYSLFMRNMEVHYPELKIIYDIFQNSGGSDGDPPIRWVNETHWQESYRRKYKCPYAQVCQQLIKLYVFDLRTKLGLDYIGDNVLIVDSDTVWGRDATFVHPDGKVTYFDVLGLYKNLPKSLEDRGKSDLECNGMDPVKFTEGITAGSSLLGPRKPTLTPYTSCRRAEYPNVTGARHIVHHMLFQYDVMMHLHSVIAERWNTTTLWEAFVRCNSHDFCKSRVAEYELYYSFVANQYPERVAVEHLVNGENYMGSSAICDEKEINCCRDRGVLLKGCHDHKIKNWERNGRKMYEPLVGDMCCDVGR